MTMMTMTRLCASTSRMACRTLTIGETARTQQKRAWSSVTGTAAANSADAARAGDYGRGNGYRDVLPQVPPSAGVPALALENTAIWLMNRNARRPRRANRGKRAVSHVGRKIKAKKRYSVPREKRRLGDSTDGSNLGLY